MIELPIIVLPKRVSKTFIQSHREWIFLYGATYYGKIYFGQGGQCADESNCFPIPTKVRNCMSNNDAFFSDTEFDYWSSAIIEAINKIPKDGRPIIPLPKIGEGCSDLKFRCPKIFAFLKEQLASVAYPSIKIDYNWIVW